MGKNKVMSIGLGTTQENEYKDNFHEISNVISLFIELFNELDINFSI